MSALHTMMRESGIRIGSLDSLKVFGDLELTAILSFAQYLKPTVSEIDIYRFNRSESGDPDILRHFRLSSTYDRSTKDTLANILTARFEGFEDRWPRPPRHSMPIWDRSEIAILAVAGPGAATITTRQLDIVLYSAKRFVVIDTDLSEDSPFPISALESYLRFDRRVIAWHLSTKDSNSGHPIENPLVMVELLPRICGSKEPTEPKNLQHRVVPAPALSENDVRVMTWSEFMALDSDAMNKIERAISALWPPYYSFSPKTMRGRADVFPEGQLLVLDAAAKKVCGVLCALRINLPDGLQSLPTWDDMVGVDQTGRSEFRIDGNAICLISMNVPVESRGLGASNMLVKEVVQKFRSDPRVEYILVLARPSSYNEVVYRSLQQGNRIPTAEEHIFAVDDQGQPKDDWIRAILTRHGGIIVKTVRNAVTIDITEEEFEFTRNASWIDNWMMIDTSRGPAWFCDDTGFIYPQRDRTLKYIESNCWIVLYSRDAAT